MNTTSGVSIEIVRKNFYFELKSQLDNLKRALNYIEYNLGKANKKNYKQDMVNIWEEAVDFE